LSQLASIVSLFQGDWVGQAQVQFEDLWEQR